MRLQTLKEIANENVHKIFDALDIHYVDKYDYLQGPCPIHNGDNPTAFSWVKSHGYFRCFTNKCERDGADIFDFVSKLKNCTFAEAKVFVHNIVIDKNYDYSKEEDEDNNESFKNYIKNNLIKKPSFKIYDESILENLTYNDYLTNRGFSEDVQKEFKVGYCDNKESKLFYQRMIIPIYNIDNNIIGFTARAVFDFKDKKTGKWVHTPGLQTSEVLFNINRASKYIKETHSVILVEGPLDVLKFHMAGIYNVVSILGSNLSGPQRSILLKNECYDIITAFDNDSAGISCTKSVQQSCKKYFTMSQYCLPEGKDIGDLSVEKIRNLDMIRV